MEKRNVKLERIFGIILLLPPILSVLLFFLNLLFWDFFSYSIQQDIDGIVGMQNLTDHWTGSHAYDGGGYTSATPIYLGLMAIAGALLLKGTGKEQV